MIENGNVTPAGASDEQDALDLDDDELDGISGGLERI